MATYRVILTGVLEGLEARRVAPQLALLCKVPVDGAMALLSSPRMVIKRALNAEMASQYKAALQKVGCRALIEQETDAESGEASPTTASGQERPRVSLNPQDLRRQLGAIAEQARSAIAHVTTLAQRSGVRALAQIGSVKSATSVSKPAVAAVVPSATASAPSPAPAARVRKSFRAHFLMIGGVALAAVAVAGFFHSEPGSSSSGGPCPGEYNAATWTNCVGEVKFPNGEKYVGELKEGQPHGQGTFIWPNGEKYVGQWQNGQRNGQGRFFWPDGDKYVGQFRNNKKHGQGTLTYANGRQYVGEFKDGQPVNQPGGSPKAEVRSQKAE